MAQIYSIATSSGLDSRRNELNFRFTFTINNDDRVHYQGHFLMEVVGWSNHNNLILEGFQSKFNIDLLYTNKIIRDYPNITKNGIREITNDLLVDCLTYIKQERISDKDIIFNVVVTI